MFCVQRATRFTGLILVLLFLVLGVDSASAQRWSAPTSEPDEATIQQAREIYRAGSDAIDNGNLTDGLSMFEESYRMSGAWMALFAIGHTLNDLGRYDESEEAFDRLLEIHGDLSDEFRVQTNDLLAEIRDRRAQLSLNSLPRAARILLDGETVVDTESRPFVIQTEPGSHHLQITAEGLEAFEWRGVAPRGETTSVQIVMPAVDAGGGLFESAWFWIAAGAVVVGVTVAVVLLSQGTQYDPEMTRNTRFVIEL